MTAKKHESRQVTYTLEVSLSSYDADQLRIIAQGSGRVMATWVLSLMFPSMSLKARFNFITLLLEEEEAV